MGVHLGSVICYCYPRRVFCILRLTKIWPRTATRLKLRLRQGGLSVTGYVIGSLMPSKNGLVVMVLLDRRSSFSRCFSLTKYLTKLCPPCSELK